ncbi:hypothetical protein N482_16565 [Pseudoalteromonas luteoviolacea NCIMB 1942]|uniref:Uncharacterized protein n=1 Tax=Pseudoalteromonas luteoviolacea NCIMB 1942 TaxID=1365253 RepID=A0A166ZJL4_9GAMM|nr:hypothetical protein N482_16565 [Pseudoalteromonas luteoviolacea NCIMB 1942]
MNSKKKKNGLLFILLLSKVYFKIKERAKKNVIMLKTDTIFTNNGMLKLFDQSKDKKG